MKNLIPCAIIIGAILFISCNRSEKNSVIPVETLTAINAKKQETIRFTFKTTSPASAVQWTVDRAQDVEIKQDGYFADITFLASGKYVISATDKLSAIEGIVYVDSSTTEPVTKEMIHTLENETIWLSPVLVDSSTFKSVIVRMETENTHSCTNSYLYFSGFNYDAAAKSFTLRLDHIVQPGSQDCLAGEKKVGATTVISPLADDSYSLHIQKGNEHYTGSIKKSGTSYTITWPYSTGVRFSKLILTE